MYFYYTRWMMAHICRIAERIMQFQLPSTICIDSSFACNLLRSYYVSLPWYTARHSRVSSLFNRIYFINNRSGFPFFSKSKTYKSYRIDPRRKYNTATIMQKYTVDTIKQNVTNYEFIKKNTGISRKYTRDNFLICIHNHFPICACHAFMNFYVSEILIFLK